MRKVILLFSFLIGLSFVSCIYETKEKADHSLYGEYYPIVMTRADFENSIEFQSVQPMIKAGKIYLKDHYIFIVDENKGVHIYDNTNQASPVEISFLKIPGATDIAIRNNVFFVNQATDLIALTIDASNQTFEVTKRIKNIFPKKRSPEGYSFYTNDNQIVVDWNKRTN